VAERVLLAQLLATCATSRLLADRAVDADDPGALLVDIVSTATAVLPVPRSPMISSRCPRPIGIIPSIALIPVCRAPDRLAIDDAGRLELERPELGRVDRRAAVEHVAERSTTRPTSDSPTGTRMTARAAGDVALAEQSHAPKSTTRRCPLRG